MRHHVPLSLAREAARRSERQCRCQAAVLRRRRARAGSARPSQAERRTRSPAARAGHWAQAFESSRAALSHSVRRANRPRLRCPSRDVVAAGRRVHKKRPAFPPAFPTQLGASIDYSRWCLPCMHLPAATNCGCLRNRKRGVANGPLFAPQRDGVSDGVHRVAREIDDLTIWRSNDLAVP